MNNFQTIENNGTRRSIQQCALSVIRFFNAAFHTHFRVTYKKSAIIGSKENDGWSGVFGMLEKNEVDLFAFDAVMTADRTEPAYFLTPFITAK